MFAAQTGAYRGRQDTHRSARWPGAVNVLQPQLTRLEQSDSGDELHLVIPLSANRTASELCQDLGS
jgi:hypothetical protein